MSANDARTIVEELSVAIDAALTDEAAMTSMVFNGHFKVESNHTLTCVTYGSSYEWAAEQYLYFARAIPEAFGYTTGYTDRGTIIVTTDCGEYLCKFKAPERRQPHLLKG